MLIEPIKRGAVFSRKPLRNPDNGHRIQPSRISQQLPQMRMVRTLKLILDQHPVISCGVLAKDIRAKWANIFFLSLKLKFNTDGFAEKLKETLNKFPIALSK